MERKIMSDIDVVAFIGCCISIVTCYFMLQKNNTESVRTITTIQTTLNNLNSTLNEVRLSQLSQEREFSKLHEEVTLLKSEVKTIWKEIKKHD